MGKDPTPRGSLCGKLIVLGATGIATGISIYGIHEHMARYNNALGAEGQRVMLYYDQNNNGVLDPEEIRIIGRALEESINTQE